MVNEWSRCLRCWFGVGVFGVICRNVSSIQSCYLFISLSLYLVISFCQVGLTHTKNNRLRVQNKQSASNSDKSGSTSQLDCNGLATTFQFDFASIALIELIEHDERAWHFKCQFKCEFKCECNCEWPCKRKRGGRVDVLSNWLTTILQPRAHQIRPRV